MSLLRAARPFLSQMRRVGEMQSVGKDAVTYEMKSIEELKKFFPYLYRKKMHHIEMLKKGHKVHYSGRPTDVVVNYTFYALSFAGFLLAIGEGLKMSLK